MPVRQTGRLQRQRFFRSERLGVEPPEALWFGDKISAFMSPNKKLVETYLTTRGRLADRSKMGSLLTEDAEWIEWGDGVPETGVRTRGKVAFVQALGDRELEFEITRMTEESNVVVAEGRVRMPKPEGGMLKLRFCNIFELENGRVRRVDSWAVPLKDSA